MNTILFVLLFIFCADISSQNEENIGLGSLDWNQNWTGLESEQHKSKPEPICQRLIQKKATNLEITPIVSVETSFDSNYPCDSRSVISQLSFLWAGDSLFTCNGIIVQKDDDSYNATFGKSQRVEQINLTNYTQINTLNNGNRDYVECGTIVGGKCHGDTLWGIGIYSVDDQEGCACDGTNGYTALVRQIEIRGKCKSRCSLGSSTIKFSEPVNNNGLLRRTVKAEQN